MASQNRITLPYSINRKSAIINGESALLSMILAVPVLLVFK